jgi:hypothetical protein
MDVWEICCRFEGGIGTCIRLGRIRGRVIADGLLKSLVTYPTK